jgi:hypothetical protein
MSEDKKISEGISPDEIKRRKEQVRLLKEVYTALERDSNIDRRRGTLFGPTPAEELDAAAGMGVADENIKKLKRHLKYYEDGEKKKR